jgi:hypothetical protein
VLSGDVKILRALATRVREIAGTPENLSRKARWLEHNALKPGEPMVICEFGGLRQNGESPIDPMLQCREPWARDLEFNFRSTIYQFDVLQDDWVVEPCINHNWHVSTSGFGVQSTKHFGSHDGVMGSFAWEPALKNLREDLNKLTPQTFSVDREGTLAAKAHLDNVVGDILPTRLRGSFWWTTGMTWTAADLIGLEQLMLSMVDDPEGLHRLMQFLHDDILSYAEWLEREGLLTLNNENDYIGSGSVGYTEELPDAAMSGRVCMENMWMLSESQETVGVGADMFAEFIFPYQKSIAEHFGMVYYGCCEPVHARWHVVSQIRNLRKVSVSPWCDEPFMARELGRHYVYCRKPNPVLVSTDIFDERAIREDLRRTRTLTRQHGCNLELVLKDVHTVRHKPERLARWIQIAREEANRT